MTFQSISVQFSGSFMSDSLRPHGLQHHQLLEPTQTHVHRVGEAIQPSHPLSSPSPTLNLSQMCKNVLIKVNLEHLSEKKFRNRKLKMHI